MDRNRKYPFYEPEEYGSMNQMVCAKAKKCKDAAALEDEYDLEIPDRAVREIGTVGDIAKYLQDAAHN